MTTGYCTFESAIGVGGVAWGPGGITGVQLPEADGSKARARLARRFPTAQETPPPSHVAEAIAAIQALLRGEHVGLDSIKLDMDRVPDFAQRVYAVARTIQPGETRTYGQIASTLGAPREMARDVGVALARNPYPIIVPCHRVVAAGGKLGGFSAAGGVATKQRLLDIERASVAWQLPLA